MVKTLPEVEQAIAEYEANLRGLERIIQEGSPEGKISARSKLLVTRENLGLLLKQRSRLTGGLAGLAGLGQSMNKKTLPIWMLIGLLAFVGMLFSSPSN
jgi:hypothetical protein